MIDWFILLTPLVVLPIVLLFGFVGCALNHPRSKTYIDYRLHVIPPSDAISRVRIGWNCVADGTPDEGDFAPVREIKPGETLYRHTIVLTADECRSLQVRTNVNYLLGGVDYPIQLENTVPDDDIAREMEIIVDVYLDTNIWDFDRARSQISSFSVPESIILELVDGSSSGDMNHFTFTINRDNGSNTYSSDVNWRRAPSGSPPDGTLTAPNSHSDNFADYHFLRSPTGENQIKYTVTLYVPRPGRWTVSCQCAHGVPPASVSPVLSPEYNGSPISTGISHTFRWYFGGRDLIYRI